MTATDASAGKIAAMKYWQRHVRAIALLPGTVTIVIPAVLLMGERRDRRLAAALRDPRRRIGGGFLVTTGVALFASTVKQFARHGKGTLAPFDPPRRLVVEGVYTRMRDPMITGICLILLGEAVLTNSPLLLRWAAMFAAGQSIYICLHEEPALVKRFGAEYEEYRRNVPALVPRLTPWTAQGRSD